MQTNNITAIAHLVLITQNIQFIYMEEDDFSEIHGNTESELKIMNASYNGMPSHHIKNPFNVRNTIKRTF